MLVLSVPFYDRARDGSRELAMIADGGVEHLQPPEFHGDPVSGGVLCFHHFGWDLLEAMREAGFTRAEAVRVRDTAQGLPAAQWVTPRARDSRLHPSRAAGATAFAALPKSPSAPAARYANTA